MATLQLLVGFNDITQKEYLEQLKSSFVHILNTDEIYNSLRDKHKLFDVVVGFATRSLKNDVDVIITGSHNLRARWRKSICKKLGDLVRAKICKIFAMPITVGCAGVECFEQRKNFQVPHPTEGWTKIDIVRNNITDFHNLTRYLTYNTSHDIEGRLESIEDHMIFASEMARISGESKPVISALAYHDIGKVFTKTFGDKCARYPKHENVSAHMYLTSSEFETDEDPIHTLYLIAWHTSFFKMSDKQQTAFARKYGRRLYEDLIKMKFYDSRAKVIAVGYSE